MSCDNPLFLDSGCCTRVAWMRFQGVLPDETEFFLDMGRRFL